MFYRCISLIIIIFLGFETSAQELNLEILIKDKQYKKIASYFETSRVPKSYKEHASLVLAYKNLGELSKLINTLEASVKLYPKKDVLVRELSKAYLDKSKTYTTVAYTFSNDPKKDKNKDKEKDDEHKKNLNLKQEYFVKALKLLDDLKNKNPSSVNLTALINFQIENQRIDQAESLLEVYSKSFTNRQTYYSLLCEVHFKKKLFTEALESCANAKKSSDVALLRYVEAKESIDSEKLKIESLVTASGRFPASSSINLEIGRRFFSEGKFKESIFYLKKSNEIKESSEAFRLIAESKFSLKDYEASIKNFKNACRIETGPKAHIFNKIRALSKKLPDNNPYFESFRSQMARCKHA